jgi:hypothetical protein
VRPAGKPVNEGILTLPVGATLPAALFLTVGMVSLTFNTGADGLGWWLGAVGLVVFTAGAMVNVALVRAIVEITRPCRARVALLFAR